MTLHTSITASPQLDTAPIVLRFRGLWPHNLGRFKMHDQREGGDLSHVDQARSDGNRILFGEPDWIKALRSEIKKMSTLNHECHLDALTKKSRIAEAARVEETGPRQPWRQSVEGPLREGILSVSKAWFGGTGAARWDDGRIARFQEASLAFLRTHFPGQQLRYAVAHMDEEAYHIHFVVAVWTQKTTGNRGQQFLLRPGANPLLSSYEHAQDLAGEHFAAIGLERGARRAAREAGTPPPQPRYHVPPSQWRARERAKAEAEAADRRAASARDAEKYLSIAEAARAHARTATRERDAAVQERDAARQAGAELEAATTRLTAQHEEMAARTASTREARLDEERKVREARAVQTDLLATSRRIERELRDTRTHLSRRESAVEQRETAAEALERGISYIVGGGIAWNESTQKFAVEADLLPVDRESLRETVRTAGPVFLRIATAISRAARVVLGRAQARIRADADTLVKIREEMGLPHDARIADVLARSGRGDGPGT